MVRGILGVVVGAVVWMVGFLALAMVLAQRWPDYAIHGPRFPWWYNLGVVIPAVPAVYLGGKLANSLRAVGR